MSRLFARPSSPLAVLRLLPLLPLFGCSSNAATSGTFTPFPDGGRIEPVGDAQTGADGSMVSTSESPTQCADGLDNDGDGLSDCQDPDCALTASCLGDASVPLVDGSAACNTAHADGVAKSSPVDVVWVIDDSLSMLPETTRIQQNMAAFAKSFVQAGVDYHIIVVDYPTLVFAAAWDAKTLGLDPSRFFPVDGVDATAWNDCFGPAINEFPKYKADLRPDAALHFIMVSDDDQTMSWSSFKTQMDQLLGGGKKYTVHAIVGVDRTSCVVSNIGTNYMDAAKATGGELANICDSDWSATFTAIENSVKTSAVIPCQYGIPEPPTGQTYDRSKVNVLHVLDTTTTPLKRKASESDCGTDQGWYYDDPQNPQQVLLCPAACTLVEHQGGSINVDFVCNANQLF